MPFCLEMSQNINSSTRDLKLGYIWTFTNLLWINNKTKTVETRSNKKEIKDNEWTQKNIYKNEKNDVIKSFVDTSDFLKQTLVYLLHFDP